jgi:beta-galactosidase
VVCFGLAARLMPRAVSRWTASLVALGFGLLAALPAAAETSDMLLNGTWSFAMAPTEAAAEAMSGFWKPGYDTSAFKPTPVPSNWAVQGFEEPHYKAFGNAEASQGFYLTHFTPPADFKDRRILLHFGGVWSSAEVWLNGKPLGRHDSGYTSFAYDVSSILKPGADNVLAVRVRQVQHDYQFDTNDDWTLGGIYRDVSLETMPKDRWLDRVDVETDFDSQYKDADLKVRVLVGDAHKPQVAGNLPGGGDPYDLRLTLLDKDGKTVQSQQTSIPAHYRTDRQTDAVLHVAAPLHWTAETPNLYSLRVDLLEKGEVAHSRTVNVGFRQITTTGGVFKVNGQPVKLRGVDRHDEYPDVGRATTPDIWLKDIQLMKAANINFVRMSHYPPNAGFLDMADKYGLYIEDEIPMGGGGDNANDPSYAAAVMLRSYETVARDLNHPSIVVWSIGNEDPLTALHIASIRTVKALDPTRPVLMPWRAEDWLPPEIDIQAPHYWSAKAFDELAANAKRPVLTSEYSHAYGNDGFGDLDSRWQAIMRHPAGAGGAIWMWADQGIRVTTRNADGTTTSSLKVVPDGWDGITDSYRNPTRDYWETKAVYAQAYPAIDKVSLAAGQTSVRVPIQNDFDFTDLSEVRIAWVLMADDWQLARSTAPLAGKPHAAADLEVPLTALKGIKPGATCYLQFAFSRPDGSEITRRSVELVIPAAPIATKPVKVAVTEQGDDTVIQAGDAVYRFSKQTGELVSAGRQGAVAITGLRPTLWRPINPNEEYVLKRADAQAQLPDLNAYKATVSDWSVTPGADGVAIRATVNYAVDDKNHFRVAYDYAVGNDGSLSVKYVVTPEVTVPWLPFVGMVATTAPALKQVRWLGLGPYDAYPNEKKASYLGVWSGAAASAAVAGTKATRWIEVTDASGHGLHIVNDGYMGVDPDKPANLRVLSVVAGRPTKFGLAEDPAQQLKVTPGVSFVGQFSLSLKP